MKIWNPFKRKTVAETSVPAPTLVVQHDELSDALAELAGVFGDGMTSDMVGSQFTCSEADTIARVLVLAGHREAAETWLRGHAQGDEDGDSHHVYEDDEDEDGHQMDEDEIRAYIKEWLA